MDKYYFTYALENHPFSGGWTMIEAPDRGTACAIFRAVHPDRIEGVLNCAGVYDEKHFLRTDMFTQGNFGRFCLERILITRVTD